MDKEIYAEGAKVRVTKKHALTWDEPWPRRNDVLTVLKHHPMPHTYGVDVDVYVAKNADGVRVILQADRIEPVEKVFPEGSLVFVTETHSTSKSSTNYAGTHLVIDTYVSAEIAKHGEAFYWAKGVEGTWYGSVRADKVALVESAPPEPEKLTPPVAPNSVGKQGEVVWVAKDTDLGGYWTYDNYWGWSNFVPTNANLYRTPVKGEDMSVNGVLATSALDGTVQAV